MERPVGRHRHLVHHHHVSEVRRLRVRFLRSVQKQCEPWRKDNRYRRCIGALLTLMWRRSLLGIWRRKGSVELLMGMSVPFGVCRKSPTTLPCTASTASVSLRSGSVPFPRYVNGFTGSVSDWKSQRSFVTVLQSDRPQRTSCKATCWCRRVTYL